MSYVCVVLLILWFSLCTLRCHMHLILRMSFFFYGYADNQDLNSVDRRQRKLCIRGRISYLSRPVSLSVRLFANMMAGHTMLKVFGGFVVSLGILGGWLPLGFAVALTGLELLVAFIQAYVFAILTCIYLNDALNLHH